MWWLKGWRLIVFLCLSLLICWINKKIHFYNLHSVPCRRYSTYFWNLASGRTVLDIWVPFLTSNRYSVLFFCHFLVCSYLRFAYKMPELFNSYSIRCHNKTRGWTILVFIKSRTLITVCDDLGRGSSLTRGCQAKLDAYWLLVIAVMNFLGFDGKCVRGTNSFILLLSSWH